MAGAFGLTLPQRGVLFGIMSYEEMLENYWSRLREVLPDHGRDPDTFPTIEYHNINIGPDREACLEESKRFLDAYYGPVFSPPMVESWTAAGTPDECIEHLNRLVEAGARQITLRLTTWDQQGQYERLVEDVLPRVDI